MKNIITELKSIGWYQIIGGAIGILIIGYSLSGYKQFSGEVILTYSFILSFFLYSIYCGILCLSNRKYALLHSLINQFIQLFGFAILGFAFYYVAGVYFSIGFDLSTSLEMKLNFGFSKFDFNINREQERIEIDFNIISFALILWIDKIRNKLKDELINREID